MKKLALAMAAATALMFAAPVAPAFTSDAQAQTVVKKKVVIKRGGGDHVRRKVVIRHGDRGLHRGWSHSRHYGARTKVVIKKRGHGDHGATVIKKKTVIR
jgi:hypothetical protein